MRLLLDLGNSRVKWSGIEAARLPGEPPSMVRSYAHGALAWQAQLPVALASAWDRWPSIDSVFAASVVDAERESLISQCALAAFGKDVHWVRTPAAACGVRNAYASPGQLGVDRFLAMVAAHADGLGDCIVVGVGTALTLDALDADGHHLGGLIAPAPTLMQQALLSATVRVKIEHAGRIVDAADNTSDAAGSGCWHAAAALVERFARRMRPKFANEPALRIGGGDAATLAALLDVPAECVEDSVLRGLAEWAHTHPYAGFAK